MISPYDLARLKSFTNNQVEYRLILDLIPTLAKLCFLYQTANLEKLKISPIQKGILIGIGLQFKTVDTLASELDLDGKQLLGKFRDLMRQIVQTVDKAKGEAIKSSLLTSDNGHQNGRPLQPLGEELNEVAQEMQQRQKEALLSTDLDQYKVKGSDEVWESALNKNKGRLNLVSVKTAEKREAENNASKDEAGPKQKKAKKNKHKKMKAGGK